MSAVLEGLLTRQSLTTLTEKLVREERMTYMEAVLHVCKERGIDPLDVGKLIHPTIKAKIEVEAMGANLLPKKSNLRGFI